MPLRIRPIALPDLGGLEATGPRLLPLDSIDEDPEQPRMEFDPEAMEDLASTIRSRGVLQPVSVRAHPHQPGRWVLNFGSRRLRASRLATREVIPAFVDESFDSYAQVIENEQREPLKPLELALFVQKRRALGETQSEIARLLGKSQAYVALATALIDAPDWLMELYRKGACKGLNELYQLRRLHDKAPGRVESWCNDQDSVSRSDVQRLAASLDDVDGALASSVARLGDAPNTSALSSASPARAPRAQQLTKSSNRLMARYQDQPVEVVTSDAPPEPGRVYVRRPSAARRSVPASEVQLMRFETNADS